MHMPLNPVASARTTTCQWAGKSCELRSGDDGGEQEVPFTRRKNKHRVIFDSLVAPTAEGRPGYLHCDAVLFFFVSSK